LSGAQYVNIDQEKIIEENSFKRKVQGRDITFEIHDSVNKFSKHDWRRVVAIFVNGHNYEFKDWPKGETIVSILLKVKGFFLKYSDFSFPSNIMKWNVKKIDINRTRRHLDVSVQNDIWKIIEDFLLSPRYRETKFH
jgi:hypothetical protein